jgi:hypothetical protein
VCGHVPVRRVLERDAALAGGHLAVHAEVLQLPPLVPTLLATRRLPIRPPLGSASAHTEATQVRQDLLTRGQGGVAIVRRRAERAYTLPADSRACAVSAPIILAWSKHTSSEETQH